MLIDSHAHLDDSKFDKDRDKLIKSLKDNGISLVINPADNLISSIKSVKLSEQYDNIYSAVGVHPHEVKDMNNGVLESLKALSKREKVVAIGEIGLDYYYDNSPRDLQKKWFREQVKLAKEIKLPIIVHSREASKDTYDILQQENDQNLTGVIHCYSGSVEMAKQYIKMGFYISFAGPITFKNAKVPKQVAKEIPLDKMLVETDSPFLAPEPHRGKRNEPIYVRYVASMIAELKGIDFEKVAKITSRNTKKLFNINHRYS